MDPGLHVGFQKIERPAGSLELFDPGWQHLRFDEIRHQARAGHRLAVLSGLAELVDEMEEGRFGGIDRLHCLTMRKMDRKERG